MSKSFSSPTSRLLQSSRLFSLPRPLPQPSLETTTSTGMYRASDTATDPYPTHQAIATPASSHFRGDWGLKRALPGRATNKTSTPHIRVRAQDNAAHITDFGSAADHTQTYAKWQEMRIPVIHREKQNNMTNSNRSVQSVYDENLDNTDPDFALARTTPAAAPQQGRGRNAGRYAAMAQTQQLKRWKYDGPWITGMQEGEFEAYILSKIEPRKAEFRKFLVEQLVTKRIQAETRTLRERGEARPATEYRRAELRKEIKENFEEEEKKLRDDHAQQHLASDLTAAICDFLDLPGVRGTRAEDVPGGRSLATEQMQSLYSSFASAADEYGPPSTHPGAGLSHLRSNAFMDNHPLWGPQAQRSPVLARVVRPRNTSAGTETQAKIGVGGIVTNDPIQSSFKDPKLANAGQDEDDTFYRKEYLNADRMSNFLEPDLPRGNKMWVQTESAHVDERGRIRLDVSRGDKEAIAVKTDDVEPIHEARSASMRGPPSLGGYSSSTPDFGYGQRSLRASSNVRGFDEELGRKPQQGQMEDNAALDKIRELMGDRSKFKR